MKRMFALVLSLLLAPVLVLAGPNAGGVITPLYVPIPVPNQPQYVDGGLGCCLDGSAEAPADEVVLWFAYASFPSNSSPRVKVVTFGCEFDADSVAILWTETRPGSIQIFYPDPAAWPYTGSGTAVAFEQTLTETTSELYCFAGYAYHGELFELAPHPDPNLGGTFADDFVPSTLDLIVGYGSMGFGVPGQQVCNYCGGPTLGACCYPDGHCEYVLESDCLELFLPGYYCEPNPCPPPMGACCLPDGECVVVSFDQCGTLGGMFVGGACEPYPCPVPLEAWSWGQIKNRYH